MTPAIKSAPSADDAALVKKCTAGDEQAWCALIDKYKNLIFSIPIKYGLSRDDATEIFQQVCVELFKQMGTLRNPTGLGKWLIQVTTHRCFHWRRQQDRFVAADDESSYAKVGMQNLAAQNPAPQLMEEVEREQMLRDALAGLSPRCRELMRLLFYEDTPRPYSEIAATLGIATGSIGFIRGRCLEKLRGRLEDSGFTSHDK